MKTRTWLDFKKKVRGQNYTSSFIHCKRNFRIDLSELSPKQAKGNKIYWPKLSLIFVKENKNECYTNSKLKMAGRNEWMNEWMSASVCVCAQKCMSVFVKKEWQKLHNKIDIRQIKMAERNE